MSQKFLLKTIIFLIFVAVVGTPLFYGGLPRIFNFQYIAQQVYPYTFSKELFFQAVVELIFGFWLALVIIEPRFRPKLTPAMKALLIFLAVLTLAAFLGLDPWRSFWSTYERGIGVIAIYHLAALGLVLSSLWQEIPWRKLFLASLWTSVIVSLLAWLQSGIPNLLLIEEKAARGAGFFRPGSTLGNPTFLDGYLIFNIFIAVYLLLDELRDAKLPARLRMDEVQAGGRIHANVANNYPHKSGEIRINPRSTLLISAFLFLSVILNVVTIFLSQTRGDILAISAGFLVLLILFSLKPPELRFSFLKARRIYAAVFLTVVIFGLGFWFTRRSPFWSRLPGLNRFQEVSFGGSDLLPRLIALQTAWKGFLERPVLGWGPENFNLVFNKYYDPRALTVSYQETRFDKPHNFVFEYLIWGGLLLASAYFTFLAITFWQAWRFNRLFGDVMLAGFATYFVANFFVFETIGPLLMLYLIFGYSDGAYRTRDKRQVYQHQSAETSKQMLRIAPGRVGINQHKSALNLRKYFAFAAIVVAIILAYFLNFQTFLASYYHYWAFQYMGNGRFSDGIEYFKKAINIWTPYRWNFERDYAMAVVEAYFYNPGAISSQQAEDALQAMENARDAHPLDAYNHYALVDLYNEISDLNLPKYTALAEKEAKIALELSPDRQEVYFSLAKTKTLKKDYPAALDLLKYTLSLDPKVADAHFYYGLVAYAAGDNITGYNEIKESLRLGRQWKNANEPRVVANFFADSGHLDEAIDLYQKSLELEPQNPETMIKLGIAYFLAGNRDLAKKYISEVTVKYNLRGNPSFDQVKPILDSLGIKY